MCNYVSVNCYQWSTTLTMGWDLVVWMIYMPYQTTRNADDVRCYKVLSSSCMPLSTSTSFPLPKSMTAMPWKRTLEVTTMYSLSANNEYTATTNDKDGFMLNMSRNYLLYQNIIWGLQCLTTRPVPHPYYKATFHSETKPLLRAKDHIPPPPLRRTAALMHLLVHMTDHFKYETKFSVKTI